MVPDSRASREYTSEGEPRLKPAGRIRVVASHLALLGIGLFFAVPFYWLVSTALKPDSQVFAMPPVWVPHPVKWENFPKALNYIPFAQYTWNTLRICLLNVIG